MRKAELFKTVLICGTGKTENRNNNRLKQNRAIKNDYKKGQIENQGGKRH